MKEKFMQVENQPRINPGEDSTHGHNDDGELIPIDGSLPVGSQLSFVEKHRAVPGEILTKAVSDLQTHFIAAITKSYQEIVSGSGLTGAEVPYGFQQKCKESVVFPSGFTNSAFNNVNNNLLKSIAAVVAFVRTADIYNESQRAYLLASVKNELVTALNSYCIQNKTDISYVLGYSVSYPDDIKNFIKKVADDWVDTHLQRKQKAIPPRS